MKKITSIISACLSLVMCIAATSYAAGGRYLAKEDIILYGMQLTAAPAKQTVPKNIATIVSTYLQVPTMPEGQVPPLAPDAVVKATLRGPGLEQPMELAVAANSPFNIPPLVVPGIYSLDGIRMEAGGEVLFYATPESVKIEIIEKLLVTQVTARPLTADEIREKGIVFDKSNFQAYNFTAAFAVAPGQEINITMPVILPKLETTQDAQVDGVKIPGIQGAQIQTLSTIIPDALKMAQTTIPNLSVQSFSLKPIEVEQNNFFLPPIPGVVVIPGDIGFLNQYFSVMLMVGNAAPEDSGLVVKDLKAEIIFPGGRDEVFGTSDDPLVMANTERGQAPRLQQIAKPGPDGRLGTGDDISELAPGESGNAEFLVEGRREGSHTVEMEISGTLYGLPIGPVQVRGRAMGTVLVRNPTFTMTFTHPDIVNAGERYNLDITVTNTSESPANFVSINLYPRYISGATLVGDPVRSIDHIPAGDSANVSYELISQVTGNVFAATLDSDEQIKGKFLLKTSVGELGIPLSPDSLVLPKESNFLPKGLRDAAIGMLGKAYATATAPAAALPPDVLRFGKRIVWDRGIEVAEAGFRHSLHEPLAATASQLLMDFMGSNVGRINERYPTQSEQDAAARDFLGFDDLRRRSVRGDALAAAVADILKDELAAKGNVDFQRELATRLAYRPGFVSVLVTGDSGTSPVTVTLVDGSGRRLGGTDEKGKITKEIPYSDMLAFTDGSGAVTGQLAMLAAPAAGDLTVRLQPPPGSAGGTYTLSIVYPDSTGSLHQTSWQGVRGGEVPAFGTASGPVRITINGEGAPLSATGTASIPDLPPSIISVVQQPQADVFKCDKKDPGKPLGRVVAILFSEEVTPASVQDKVGSLFITNYAAEQNKVVGISLQPGRRIAFVALRDPLGPFIPRAITVSNVADGRGNVMESATVPMEATIEAFGGVVSGRILQADGSTVPGAEIRLVLQTMCPDSDDWIDVGIAAKAADMEGRYHWDYVRGGDFRVKEIAIDPDTNDVRRLLFSIARHGQRLNADIVFLGRGTVQGRMFGEDGITPLKDVKIKITNLVDQTEYGATTDADGRYVITRVPIGNSLLEAVHVATNSHVTQSVYIGSAGAVVEVDLSLLTEEVRKIQVKYGEVSGTVLRPDGMSPVAGVPVIAWYQHLSQPGVQCPCLPCQDGCCIPKECAVAMTTTDDTGGYTFPSVVAGQLRFNSFDQAVYQQGNIFIQLGENEKEKGNILLNGGFGTVRGTVLDADGNPVAGAQVGGGLVLATTDATGTYELKDVPIGHASIVAVSQALGASGTAEVDIVRNGEVVNATIVLSAIGGVYGTVRLADGVTPAAGIDVFAVKREGESIIVVGSAVTDGEGRYVIEQLPVIKADYTITAFLPDVSDGNIVPARVLFNGHRPKADITFRGKGRVEGVIYDDDGATPLKARVSVSGLAVKRAKGPGGKMVGLDFVNIQHIRIVDTDFTTGRFAFDNVFVGQFVITAAGAFSPDLVTFADELVRDGETRQVVLKLQPTSVITGRVFQPDGFTPVGEAIKVTFTSNESKTFCKVNMTTGEDSCETIPQGIQEEIVYTQPDGTFKLPIVNAGTFTLTAVDPVTGKSAQLKGHVAAGQTADVKMRLVGKANVHVQVFASDGITPIKNARVDLEQGAFPKTKMTATAVDGTVTFNGIDEGTVVVLAQDLSRGFSGRANGKVVQDGFAITLRVFLYDATGTVYGTVYRPDGTTAVPNADVAIFNADGPLAFSVTDADGRFEQDTIPLGDVKVSVFEALTGRRGAGAGTVDFVGQRVPIIINEAAIGHVRGMVYAAGTMAPLRGWQVRLSVAFPDGSGLSLIGTTGTDGGFFFPGIPQGVFTITASRDGLGSITAQGVITRENELVEMPLLVSLLKPSLGRIEGIVLKDDGTPAADYAVCIDPMEKSCAFNLTAGSDGTFGVDGLSLGRHIVIASSQVAASSGSAMADIAFAGEAAFVKIVVNGFATVAPTVVWQDNAPAAGVQVVLEKAPDAGCGAGSCVRYADQSGNVSFPAVPPGTYTVWAHDPVSGLSGATAGVLHAGDTATPRLVLEVNGTVTGTAIYPDGINRPGIIVELAATGGVPRSYYTTTDATGSFTLRGVKAGPYLLKIVDPLGSGVGQKALQIDGREDLGTIVLDDAPPSVKTIAPVPGALRVPLDQKVTITFNEPVQPGSVTPATVVMSDGGSAITGTLALGDGNTTVTVTPIAPLKEQTVYTVQVQGIRDNLNRPMAKPFIGTFTTVDLTPPAVQSLDPAPSSSGLPLESVIRIVYNEPIDPGALSGPAIVVTRNGSTVMGRTDMIFGNTGMVFTPTYPWAENTAYHVEIQPVTDLSGNRQTAPVTFDFSSLDRKPPVIVGLNPSNGGTVIEGSTGSVTVDLTGTSDIAFVDFMVNGVIVTTDRTGPFTFNLLAVPSLGAPGETIKISAVATDTSGNRGAAVDTWFTITADTPPAVAITAPADGAAFKTGERVNVAVTAADDVGVSLIGYQAIGGVAPAAATAEIVPAASPASKAFAFYVPVDAVPGSTIVVNATAIDTKGQSTKATPVSVVVLDATPPLVQFTGTSSGSKVKPGQQVTAVVSASDLGGVASLEFRVSGGTVYSETRLIVPELSSVATSFTFTVSQSVGPLDTVNLDVVAVDKAGNRTSAPQVVLPVADLTPPRTSVRTLSGSTEMVPGQQMTIVVEATDEIGVQRVDLTGTGAFNYTNSKGISPPLGSAHSQFTLQIPANLVDGAVLTLEGTATDISGNVSQPAVLVLTSQTLTTVTLPGSTIVNAGEIKMLEMQLSSPAPASGVVINMTSGNAGIALATPTVIFAEGEQVRQFSVTGVAGGTTQLRAFIGGIERGAMTVTVSGGIVTGTVYNPYPTPVAGAEVVVNSYSTVTGADGRFSFTGIRGPGISISAFDPQARLRGYVYASMNAANGYLRDVDVVLIPAAAVSGTVLKADGVTSAGAGVQVQVFRTGDLSVPVDTVFTDDAGGFHFPLLQIGSYVIEAVTAQGDKGRGSAAIIQSGVDVTVNVTFLGKGSITGEVVDGAGNPVANPEVRLSSYSLFGTEQRAISGNGDGTFSFGGIFVGDISLSAKDPVTKMSAGASGKIAANGENVRITLRLASVASITGTVYRYDGVTAVAGAAVGAGSVSTTTDSQGTYLLETLPLGVHTVTADDKGARSRSKATVSLQTHNEVQTQNLTMPGQGSVIATVTNSDGPVGGAKVTLTDGYGSVIQDTAADGIAVFNKVQAGTFTVSAVAGNSSGSGGGTVAVGGTAQVALSLPIIQVPSGSIGGTVYAPDGKTPLAGIRVAALQVGTVYTDADGRYRFDNLPLKTHSLTFIDQSGMTRAKAAGLVLDQDGQSLVRDAVFVGLGSVTGRVLMPDSSSASTMRVSVRSLNRDFGLTSTAITDAAGYYLVERMPVGPFTVTAGDAVRQLLGEGAGTLNTDGDTATADLILQNNAFTPPRTLRDGNLYTYDIQADGTVSRGEASIFSQNAGTGLKGAASLEIAAGGTSIAFTGDPIATQEDQSRELTMRQQGLHGLNVTRKVFVPLDGYFARYLEIVSNPTSEPVTVDLKVRTNFAAGSNTFAVTATSSGDSQLDQASDDWMVIDDQNATQPPAIAHVWRSGAVTLQPEVSFTPAGSSPANIQTTWRSIMVEPGRTIGLLHFLVQQTGRDGAQQAADRLAQLPPEGLAGLSGDELTAIMNCEVPADGTSLLASLPSLTGEITGQVVAGDGVTPAPSGTPVTLLSDHPLFARSYQATTDGSGIFRFVSNLLAASPTVAIPVDAFTLKARIYAGAAYDSPVIHGSFAVGASSTTKNVPFTNTGILLGTVQTESGQPVAGATVRAASGPYNKSATTPLNGGYRFAFVPPGTYTVTAEKASSQGSAAIATLTAVVSGETETTADLVFPALVTVTGTLKSASGAAVGGASVKLASGSFLRSVVTDASGKFTFIDVPAGTYSVTGTEPGTGLTVTTQVAVAVGAPPVSLVLPASGRITGTVRFADAATTATGVVIEVFDATAMTLLRTVTSGTTYDTGSLVSDASGFLVRGTFTYSTPGGNRSVKAERVIGGFNGSGVTLTADLTLLVNRTTLLSRLLLEDGSRYLGDSVSLEVRTAGDGYLLGTCVASMAGGECSVANVVAGSDGVTVSAMGAEGIIVEKAASITASGGTTTVELTMPVIIATVPVLFHDGNAASYRIAGDGRITGGVNGLFDTGNPMTGGSALELVSAGTGHPFTGGRATVTRSGNGREIALRQDSLAGLTVIRRIFVPRDGYFVRYVDTLINPGAAPVTVGLNLRSHPAPPGSEPVLTLTSSNDAELQPELDRWAVLDDTVQDDPFVATSGNLPATAFVWQGNGAAGASGVSYGTAAGFLATWGSVTIPAGGTAEFLYFISQQASRSGAQASAARLALLPPEALSGLGSTDLAAVRNFITPAGGQSALSPLPPLDGSVNGKVMASDGVTIAPAGTPVRFTSDSPYYGRTYRTTTDATGSFGFVTALDQGAATVGIVRDAYALNTSVTIGGVTVEAAADSSFADGSAVSVRNIFFTIMPKVTALAPSQLYANQSPITLQLSGSNFTAESEVLLDGQTLATEYVSATSLRTTVPTLYSAGAKAVAVRNPDPLHPGSHVTSAAATLTVNLPQFVLTPNPLTIRQKESGTMTLAIPFPATAGGVTAAITSTDPATVTAPATVTVPAGQTSVSFTVSAPDTAQTRNVTAAVHANAGNWLGNSTQVTVRPEPSVNLSPTTLLSGQGFSFFLVVSLTDPAPAGGLAVGLAASTPNVVSFPASVTVPAGATQFQVTAVNTGTGSTIITATPAAGSGFSAGDACAVTVKPVQTYNIGPTISKSIGVQVGTPTIPPPAPIKVTPLLSRPVGITVGPVITGITPDRSAIGTQGQLVRILGTGLGVVTGISFSPADGITVREGTLTVAPDGSYAEVTIDLALDAPVSPRVVVAKTATGSVKPAVPGATQFLVTYPPPQLLSLVPNSGVAGTSMTLQVNGRYLTGASVIAFEPATGISVGNNITVSSDGTLASVPITVDAAAGVGRRVVTITTPGGTTSSAMTVANAFTVMSEAGPYYPNIVAPQVGVMVLSAARPPVDVRYTPFTSLPVGVVVGPVITGIQPVSGAIGTTGLVVRVNGKNLAGVNSIAFHPATGITISEGSFTVAADGSYVEITIAIASDAPLDPRAVIVRTASGVVPPSSPGANLFRVTLPQPLIYGISPIRSQVGSSFTLTVNGTLLSGATKIAFSPPDGITVSNPPTVSADGNAATVVVVVAANAPTIPRIVTISTPGGTTNSMPSAANTFTVTADAGISYTPIVSGSVGVMVVSTPAATTKDAAYGPVLSPAVGVTVTVAPPPEMKNLSYTPIISRQVGVVVGPIIRTMTPTTLEPGKTVTLTFTGVALDGVTNLAFAPAAGLTVGTLTVSADGTVLTAEVAADASIIRGPRMVTPKIGATSIIAPVPWTNLLYVGARPVISSISPILQTVGNTFSLTINGTNLDRATSVRFKPEEGVLVLNPPEINTAGTQATVTVIIDGMAAGGQRVVIIEGVYGGSDETAGANNTFTVSRPVVEAPSSVMLAGEPSSTPFAEQVAGFPAGSHLVALVLQPMPGIPMWRQEFRQPLLIEQLPGGVKRQEGEEPFHDRGDELAMPVLLAMAPCGYRGPPDSLAV